MPKEKNNESQNRKFFQEMTFEYDAFKDAVYISSQAAKDLGIDEIIYHPKNHEFSFFNKSEKNDIKFIFSIGSPPKYSI